MSRLPDYAWRASVIFTGRSPPGTTESNMTEQEWLSSTDPAAMLNALENWEPALPAGTNIDRKLRLFACACCRHPAVWDGVPCPTCGGMGGWYSEDNGQWVRCVRCNGTGTIVGLTDPRSRRAVEAAERYADGEATFAEVVPHRLAVEALQYAYWNEHRSQELHDARLESDPQFAAMLWACAAVADATRGNPGLPGEITGNQRILNAVVPPAAQAALLRDVVGNPWRPVAERVRHCPACGPGGWEHVEGRCCPHSPLAKWRGWNNGTVLRIARNIYDERHWHNMPILHDALLDAGCDDEAILAHCRSDGPHVRGCWVVDLLLGKG